MSQVVVVHLYPELLNLYGDRGNLLALVRRGQWRGIDVRVVGVSRGERLPLERADLVFMGGGEDMEQRLVAEDLARLGPELRAFVADGGVILSVCGGYQLLGHRYREATGQELPGLGLLDVETVSVPGARRLVGNIAIRLPWLGNTLVVGFENHGGRTTLGSQVSPFGTVVAGHGNNGRDGTEGAWQATVFGTYLHGPLLPKNPALADHFLRLMLRRKGKEDMLEPLDDRLEEQARQQAMSRFVREGARP